MRGNIYISLNESTYESLIPTELVDKYGNIPVLLKKAESDDDEDVFEVKERPTFKEIGKANEGDFGVVIKVVVDDSNYYVLELDASWASSEVSALLKLGSGLKSPNNTLMTNKEAINFINKNAPEEE